eukprot:4098755-Amphidinium_carterae.2
MGLLLLVDLVACCTFAKEFSGFEQSRAISRTCLQGAEDVNAPLPEETLRGNTGGQHAHRSAQF